MIFWREFLTLKKKASLLPIIFAPSNFGRMIRRQGGTRTSPVESLVSLLTFLSITSTFVLEADLFLHTFEYDFMVKTMKQDITKAIQFSNTFRYIDDLFSINNVNFGNCISAIYPSELKDTSTSSTEGCYLDTNIKTGDVTTPFRISIYDK